MNNKIIIFVIFIIYPFLIFAQQNNEWPVVSYICEIADFFSKLVLVFSLFSLLRVGYNLIMSKGVEDLYSAKKTVFFILLGIALSLSYLIILRKILGENNICPLKQIG